MYYQDLIRDLVEEKYNPDFQEFISSLNDRDWSDLATEYWRTFCPFYLKAYYVSYIIEDEFMTIESYFRDQIITSLEQEFKSYDWQMILRQGNPNPYFNEHSENRSERNMLILSWHEAHK